MPIMGVQLKLIRLFPKRLRDHALGIRATARVFEVAPNTVLQWLVEAAEPLRAFSAYFRCDLHLGYLRKAGQSAVDRVL